MTEKYGVLPTGYARKPLDVILSELEAGNITQFGPGVIQTAQSPLGQLNGLMADLLAELDERNLETYQSYDPDQAEGMRLNTLGRLRLLTGKGLTEDEFRRAITNEGRGRIDVQDLAAALYEIDGVIFARVYVNDVSEFCPCASVSVAVVGGDDEAIARTARKHIAPGVSTFGNWPVNIEVGGYCRTITLIRPVVIPVTIQITVKTRNNQNDCPPPSGAAMATLLQQEWGRRNYNGKPVNLHYVRNIIECTWDGVEVTRLTGTRRNDARMYVDEVPIDFFEIAEVFVSEVIM